MFLDPKFVYTESFFVPKIFVTLIFWAKILVEQIFFGPKIFWTQNIDHSVLLYLLMGKQVVGDTQLRQKTIL